MFDDDLVRRLCREILEEKDPEKTAELLSLLRAVIKDNQDEIRERALFLVRKYGFAFQDFESAA